MLYYIDYSCPKFISRQLASLYDTFFVVAAVIMEGMEEKEDEMGVERLATSETQKLTVSLDPMCLILSLVSLGLD